MRHVLWLLLLLGCENPVAPPEEIAPGLNFCIRPDTVWVTLNGDSTVMLLPPRGASALKGIGICRS